MRTPVFVPNSPRFTYDKFRKSSPPPPPFRFPLPRLPLVHRTPKNVACANKRRIINVSPGFAKSQLLSSITPNKQELAMNHLAPLWLVSHNPEHSGSEQQQLINASAGSLAAAMGSVVSALLFCGSFSMPWQEQGAATECLA